MPQTNNLGVQVNFSFGKDENQDINPSVKAAQEKQSFSAPEKQLSTKRNDTCDAQVQCSSPAKSVDISQPNVEVLSGLEFRRSKKDRDIEFHLPSNETKKFQPVTTLNSGAIDVPQQDSFQTVLPPQLANWMRDEIISRVLQRQNDATEKRISSEVSVVNQVEPQEPVSTNLKEVPRTLTRGVELVNAPVAEKAASPMLRPVPPKFVSRSAIRSIQGKARSAPENDVLASVQRNPSVLPEPPAINNREVIIESNAADVIVQKSSGREIGEVLKYENLPPNEKSTNIVTHTESKDFESFNGKNFSEEKTRVEEERTHRIEMLAELRRMRETQEQRMEQERARIEKQEELRRIEELNRSLLLKEKEQELKKMQSEYEEKLLKERSNCTKSLNNEVQETEIVAHVSIDPHVSSNESSSVVQLPDCYSLKECKRSEHKLIGNFIHRRLAQATDNSSSSGISIFMATSKAKKKKVTLIEPSNSDLDLECSGTSKNGSSNESKESKKSNYSSGEIFSAGELTNVDALSDTSEGQIEEAQFDLAAEEQHRVVDHSTPSQLKNSLEARHKNSSSNDIIRSQYSLSEALNANDLNSIDKNVSIAVSDIKDEVSSGKAGNTAAIQQIEGVQKNIETFLDKDYQVNLPISTPLVSLEPRLSGDPETTSIPKAEISNDRPKTSSQSNSSQLQSIESVKDSSFSNFFVQSRSMPQLPKHEGSFARSNIQGHSLETFATVPEVSVAFRRRSETQTGSFGESFFDNDAFAIPEMPLRDLTIKADETRFKQVLEDGHASKLSAESVNSQIFTTRNSGTTTSSLHSEFFKSLNTESSSDSDVKNDVKNVNLFSGGTNSTRTTSNEIQSSISKATQGSGLSILTTESGTNHSQISDNGPSGAISESSTNSESSSNPTSSQKSSVNSSSTSSKSKQQSGNISESHSEYADSASGSRSEKLTSSDSREDLGHQQTPLKGHGPRPFEDVVSPVSSVSPRSVIPVSSESSLAETGLGVKTSYESL
ncbi:hypothetical protein HDU84_009019 [Entophlyctis sp. JEL0112]|nr:hypothetical protein HDU84_009019 [Entophlyctis sp. JEL0112]